MSLFTKVNKNIDKAINKPYNINNKTNMGHTCVYFQVTNLNKIHII